MLHLFSGQAQPIQSQSIVELKSPHAAPGIHLSSAPPDGPGPTLTKKVRAQRHRDSFNPGVAQGRRGAKSARAGNGIVLPPRSISRLSQSQKMNGNSQKKWGTHFGCPISQGRNESMLLG